MKKRVIILVLTIIACYLIDKNSTSIIVTYFTCPIGVVSGIFLLKVIYDLYIRLCIKKRNTILMMESNDEINRDVNVDYSPAVLSYLMDQKIEKKKDIIATLLKLYGENIINIYQQNGRYVFEKGTKEKELDSDEKYIYNCFIGNEQLNIYEWEKKVKQEYKKYKFSKEKESLKDKSKRFKKNYAITTIILSIIINIIAYLLYKTTVEYIAAIIAVIIFINAIVFFTVYILQIAVLDENIYLSSKGEKEVIKWMSFKRFINEYTLIKDRTIEETKLFEKYIPYAMALNINQAYRNKKFNVIEIEEFIKYFTYDHLRSDVWNIKI